MIKTNSRIYGEPNDPNTVIASTDLNINDTLNLIVGNGNKGVKAYTPGSNKLIISNGDGTLGVLDLGVANKAIGTDSEGNIVLIDREE